jgi:HrpA-like RNA helicase
MSADPSASQNLRARDILLRINAIDQHSRLSDIGQKMVRLPMSPMVNLIALCWRHLLTW